MKVVVAGGNGLIGSAIVKKLKQKGWEVIINELESFGMYEVEEEFPYGQSIDAFVNAAYPNGFIKHATFFQNRTQELCENYKDGKFSIVNIASIYGIIGPDDSLYEGTDMKMHAWYAAAKGAIVSHSRCMAVRYAPNVRINCVSPGGVFDNQPESFVKKYCEKVPMGRMASPEDVAGVVAFLLSDDADYITGQNIIIDGGLTAGL